MSSLGFLFCCSITIHPSCLFVISPSLALSLSLSLSLSPPRLHAGPLPHIAFPDRALYPA